MLVYVEIRYSHRHIYLDVEPSDTVYDIKEKIYDKEGIPPYWLIIFWKRKPTIDNQTVSELGTNANSLLKY